MPTALRAATYDQVTEGLEERRSLRRSETDREASGAIAAPYLARGMAEVTRTEAATRRTRAMPRGPATRSRRVREARYGVMRRAAGGGAPAARRSAVSENPPCC